MGGSPSSSPSRAARRWAPTRRFLDLYHKLGLRVASLTHTRRNIYADGCRAAGDQGGLTAAGKALIDRMGELGIVVDLVHIGERGFWEILDRVDRPVILSHTTPTMFPNSDPASRRAGGTPRARLELPRDRQMLEAIARNGGVLGLIHITHRNLSEVVDDIETALEVMGPDHVGLGSRPVRRRPRAGGPGAHRQGSRHHRGARAPRPRRRHDPQVPRRELPPGLRRGLGAVGE